MKWVEDFYSLQYELVGKIDEKEIANNYNVDLLSILPPASIVELGSGRGEFAIVAAKSGYSVTAIEIVKKVCDEARELAAEHSLENVEFKNIDFYEFNSSKKFDILCYWDGFGLGEDIDQIKLLSKFKANLSKDSVAYIEVYSPAYWSKVKSETIKFGNKFSRKYSYDKKRKRLLDFWWKDDEKKALKQSLKCYSKNEFEVLINKSGYRMVDIIPTGYIDNKTMTFKKTKDIKKCMSYICVLKIE